MNLMNTYWKYARHISLVVLAAILLLGSPNAVLAADSAGSLDIRREKGFGRLVFTFDHLPEYSTQTISTVFVLKFKTPVSIDLRPVVAKLPELITIARRDPDGYGLRFAMIRDYKVNVMKAGNHLIVDFLSKSWRGRPPGLPKDVIEQLAREAEVARLAKAERARQEAMQRDPLLVEVHDARQPTFNRIQFNWNRFVTAQLTRKGNEVSVLFGGRAIPDLAALKINPPKNLKRIKHVLGKNSLQIIMQVSKGTKVRAFREGKNYVVDLTIAKPKKLTEVEKSLYAAARAESEGGQMQVSEEISLPGDDQPQKSARKVANIAKDGEAGPKNRALASPPKPTRSKQRRSKKPEPLDLLVPANKTDTKPIETENVVAKPQGKTADDLAAEAIKTAKLPGTVEILGDLQPATKPQKKSVKKIAGQKATSIRGAIIPADNQPVSKPKDGAALSDDKIEVIRNENSVQLRFPFQKKDVPAAIFQRSENLWVLIDSQKPLDAKNLKAQLSGIVRNIRHRKLGKSQLFEFQLSGPWLSSVSQRSATWDISIGDLVTGGSKKLQPVKQINNDGLDEVFIPMATRGHLHHITDRQSGDKLVVVTSSAPAQSIKKLHEHVDFQLFKSIHGVVIRPLSDELRISRMAKGVKIVGPYGLYFSGNIAKVVESAQAPKSNRRKLARKLSFRKIKSGEIGKFRKRTQELQQLIIVKTGRDRRKLRLELAGHWLSHGFAPESKAMLEIAASDEIEVEKDPVFRLMRGISNVMLRRYPEARKDLETNDLEDNPHASLWRGIAAYRQKKFARAHAEMKKGEPAIKLYHPEQQSMFRLASADIALEQNDIGLAGAELDKLSKKQMSPMQSALAKFLEGRLMELQNRSKEAMQLYADATKSGLRPVTARAVYQLTDLRLRIGDMKPDAGIDILERLSVVWRGDEVELQVLHRLADLYLDKGRYNDAYFLMETAVRAYPKAELALSLQDRMKAHFQELFLQGKADDMPPVKALALFYENKRLTPPGRLGDEMIRRLADRLIGVDLLDKAAELLDHQVTRRLKGAGRAQVAIRLAMIHLMQHRPKKALKTIYRTRQPRLPNQVRQARKLLEARAYAELGRSGPALELLASDETREAGEIRSLALWNGKKWTKAGEQYEKILGGQWQEEAELSGKARLQVLRAAISYTLGGDHLGVRRLRDKYAKQMSSGRDSEAFAMITDPLKSNDQAIGRLARDIADIDTLEAFIKAFRQRLQKTGGPQTTSAVQ